MWNMLSCVILLLWAKSGLVFGEAYVPVKDELGMSGNGYQSWIWDFKNNLFPTLPIAAPWSEDKYCRDDSRLLVENLKNNTLWAMQSKFLSKFCNFIGRQLSLAISIALGFQKFGG